MHGSMDGSVLRLSPENTHENVLFVGVYRFSTLFTSCFSTFSFLEQRVWSRQLQPLACTCRTRGAAYDV